MSTVASAPVWRRHSDAPDPSVPLIEFKDVSRLFRKRVDLAGKLANMLGANLHDEVVHAVDAVSLKIWPGEVLGLAGESGSGKSTLGRMAAGVLQCSGGKILHRGKDISGLSRADKRAYAVAIQMIFQDPYNSLNPRLRVRDIVGEAPFAHRLVPRAEVDKYVSDMLARVKMDGEYMWRYPHQFSGGQRQRIGIARALAVQPEMIVCDEAVAALDVSIQAQIINLFMELRSALGLTYLFISHDLGVIEHLSDRVAIMYLGRIVEIAPTPELFKEPNHPYTKALLDEVPRIEKRKRDFQGVEGEIPSPINRPAGCHFHPRCAHAMPICRELAPPLREIASGRLSACHLNG